MKERFILVVVDIKHSKEIKKETPPPPLYAVVLCRFIIKMAVAAAEFWSIIEAKVITTRFFQ